MKRISPYLLLLSSGFLATSTLAAEKFDLQRLQTLFNGFQRIQAYNYANLYLTEQEGDSTFDYIYGVAAIDAGHASQGVFALERVLIQFPNDHLARLELARGYFILEEYARSRQEFEAVLAVNPPKGVRDTTDVFLEQIRLKEARYRTTTGGSVAFGLGHDSNVNSGPDSSGLSAFPLDETSRGLGDNYSELNASWGVGHPFAPGWMATANITAALRINQDASDFDTTTGTLQAGISRVQSASRYKGEVLYQQYQLDGTNYRNMSGMNLDWQYSLDQTTKLNTGVQYVMLDYPTQATKNSTLSSLSFTYTQTLTSTWNPIVFTSINLGQETPDTKPFATADRDILGVRVGTILGVSAKFALQIAAGFQSSQHAEETDNTTLLFLGENPGFARQDDLITANVNLLWLINKDWRLDTKLGYTKNDSNVQLYSYDRTTIGLEANYAF